MRSSVATKTIPVGILALTPVVAITGIAQEGQTLTVSPGIWDPGVQITVQWMRNGAEVVGANGTTYQITSQDIGNSISVKVNGSKLGFIPKEIISSPTLPVVGKPIPKPSFIGSGSLSINSTYSIYIGSLFVRTGKVSPDTGVSVFARIWCETTGRNPTILVQYPTLQLTLTTNNSYGNAGSFAGIVDISKSYSRQQGVFGTNAKIRGEVTASNTSGSTTALIEGPYIWSCLKG